MSPIIKKKIECCNGLLATAETWTEWVESGAVPLEAASEANEIADEYIQAMKGWMDTWRSWQPASGPGRSEDARGREVVDEG